MLLTVRRNGREEPVDQLKMLLRLRQQDTGMSDDQLRRVIDRAVAGFSNGVDTSLIDDELAECAANLAVEHIDYGLLASRIAYSKYLRTIPQSFTEYLEIARQEDMLSEQFRQICHDHATAVRDMLNECPPVELTYFALRTLQSGYLLQYRRAPRACFEHPKFMYLRVAIQMFKTDLVRVRQLFFALARNEMTVASPILFSAGSSPHSLQFASCFVVRVRDDSVDGMYSTVHQIAQLMKNLGGIGLDVSCLRSRGTLVKGHNGTASGVVSYLSVADATCQHISQGGGKRKGVLAAYLPVYHPEIFEFLCMKRVDGPEQQKARSLFYGLWIPDEFMRRVQKRGVWSLMCPSECPGLNETYGDEFDRLYRSYESEGRYRRQVPALELLAEIVKSMIETGNPYIMFKDNVNHRSNQKNIGVIRGSNLCSEICLYFDKDETAVCMLGAVVLHRGVRSLVDDQRDLFTASSCCSVSSSVSSASSSSSSSNSSSDELPDRLTRVADYVALVAKRWAGKPADCDDLYDDVEFPDTLFATHHEPTVYYDFSVIEQNARLLVRGLNNLIDDNVYASPEAKRSNMLNRPLGIGVQGLANLFAKLGLPFDSPEARLLNRLIFEHIYHAALDESVKMSREFGPYKRFVGSPMSRGEIQPVMWNAKYATRRTLDWPGLIASVVKHGVRNSTLTAIMPTATTAQMWNNNESIEPFTTNLFYRRVLSGQFVVVNEHLLRTLGRLGIWEQVYEQLMTDQGSVQRISAIPDSVKALYKTAWELPQKVLIDHSVDRAPFIDQSQSLNIWMADPSMAKISAMLMYAWRKGLKTGCYYLRTKPAFKPACTAACSL